MLELLFLALSNLSIPSLASHTQSSPSVVLTGWNPSEIPHVSAEKFWPLSQKTSVLVRDMPSGETLVKNLPDSPRPIASLTKIMTFLIIIEEHDLDEAVTVTVEAAQAGGTGIGLISDETITVYTLLEALLIPSANDAAVALAIHNSGSEKIFVEKMNTRAKEWGLSSAKFHNASGLDFLDEVEKTPLVFNEMSAEDLIKITRLALRYALFRQIVEKPYFTGYSIDRKIKHQGQNTNKLLGDEEIFSRGIKTGYTQSAGECLIHWGRVNDRDVISIILGSDDRFGDTKKLMHWLEESVRW